MRRVSTKAAPVWFLVRREPLYHKLQYSKVPKYDVAAAVFGVVIGAFIVFLTLGSVGSGGIDLTDLTVIVWYAGVWLTVVRLWFSQARECPRGARITSLWAALILEVGGLALAQVRALACKRPR